MFGNRQLCRGVSGRDGHSFFLQDLETDKIPGREEILAKVRALVQEKATAARYAMEQAQASANSESKSSMGDKYETGRAMAQLDRDLYAQRYDQILQDMEVLDRIALVSQESPTARLGSVVETTVGVVFLSVSLGLSEVSGCKVMVVSVQSPLGRLIVGKAAGNAFQFQGKQHKVISVK